MRRRAEEVDDDGMGVGYGGEASRGAGYSSGSPPLPLLSSPLLDLLLPSCSPCSSCSACSSLFRYVLLSSPLLSALFIASPRLTLPRLSASLSSTRAVPCRQGTRRWAPTPWRCGGRHAAGARRSAKARNPIGIPLQSRRSRQMLLSAPMSTHARRLFSAAVKGQRPRRLPDQIDEMLVVPTGLRVISLVPRVTSLVPPQATASAG